jgi:succinate dehydrogenase/fumarate reductase flavoprotein subunit
MEWAKDSLSKLEATREARLCSEPPEIDIYEAEKLLDEYHPDYLGMQRNVRIGPNADNGKFPHELADLLESDSQLPFDFDPTVDLETDVLILGGGGAGASAALALEGSGLTVHLATKLRLGDSNTIMAEGGIQASLGVDDSPRRHFADAYVGGHGNNDPDLLRVLCENSADTIRWLGQLGCILDTNEDGTFQLRPGGGTSLPRVLACKDYTGLEIMRVLKDAVLLSSTKTLQNHAALELLDDGGGQVSGAVLWDRSRGNLVTVSARAVIIATGGSGQLRFQEFPTSNHLGAVGDGLILAYRQGCKLVDSDSHQYHPSGTAYPEALVGQLVTESIRSMGAQVVNAEGRRFANEMTLRDVLAAAIIREVAEKRGVQTPTDRAGVWLDTPLIDLQNGEGVLRRKFPGIIHRFERYNINPAKQPILIYPTLHYQNGGIQIDRDCRTEVRGLWAAGEVTGGVHGTNRLMGNSLLDITVFGRRAAISIQSDLPERRPVTLTSLKGYRESLQSISSQSRLLSPQLFPTKAGMKIAFERKMAMKQPNEGLGVTDQPSFEPPDPFAK